MRVTRFTLSLLVLAVLFRILPIAEAEVEARWIDQSVKPCEDFYRYANGEWLNSNPIPEDRSSWGTGSELQEKNLQILHQILEEASADSTAPEGSTRRKVGAFYRSGMDLATIESEGARPLEDELRRIDALEDTVQLLTSIGRLHRMNIFPAFRFFIEQDLEQSKQSLPWLYQGGLGLQDLEQYLSDEEKQKAIRDQYLDHIRTMFELLGATGETSTKDAQAVLSLETSLAEISMTRSEQADPQAIYHRMSVQQFQELIGQDWRPYFAEIGLTDGSAMNVAQPVFFQEVASLIWEIPLREWKAYLKWHLIHAHADKLSPPFVNEDFRFFGKVIAGAEALPPRWKMILQITQKRMGEAVGRLYVEKTFSQESKTGALDMVNNLKMVLRERLSKLDWMENQTRTEALRKLDTMVIKIGYPDEWSDHTGLRLDHKEFVLNVIEADQFEFRRKMNKLGKPLDRQEWAISPTSVNAGYNPSVNDLTFPAGILQPPFFDPKADPASNYGAIGMILGHEMTHAFDDIGRQFDADGNLKVWWSEEDSKNFTKRADKLKNQFSDYIAIDTTHINGLRTLGENIADLGGLKLAYLAFRKSMQGKDGPADQQGWTPDQRFFLSFAQTWRRKIRSEELRLMLATDTHAPPRFRVLGTLENMPEFAKAFQCEQKKSPVEIW